MAAQSKSELNLTLYRGFPEPGVYVWSPFVTKLEARLRFARLSYRTEPGSLGAAPRGKLPYLAISNGDSTPPIVLGDSALICEKLTADGVIGDINAELSPTEKAQDLAFRALLEDRVYFYQVYDPLRWLSIAEIPLISFFFKQIDWHCFPTSRPTKDGTRTTTRCAPKSSPHYLTPSK